MADLDLLALLGGGTGSADPSGTPERIGGVTLGVVTDIKDPDGLGRVKVRLPWLSQCVEAPWAQVAVPWAGRNRGCYLPPDVGDDAVVAFEHGDVRFPFVVGFVWSEQAPPPERSPKPPPERSPKPPPELRRYELRSGKGHRIVFDDGEDTPEPRPGPGAARRTYEPKLTIHSQSGHDVTLDDESGKITITTAGGKVTLELDGNTGSVAITAAKNLALEAPNGMVSITGNDVQVVATNELKLDGGSVVRIAC